VLLQDVYSSTL